MLRMSAPKYYEHWHVPIVCAYCESTCQSYQPNPFHNLAVFALVVHSCMTKNLCFSWRVKDSF